MATATAATYRAEGRAMDTRPSIRFVTASLEVRYVRPTPAGSPLEVRGRVKELKGRKAVIAVALSAEGQIRAKGRVVGVQIPETMTARGAG
jgi:acyl-CoA thioesterase FadM